MPQLQHVIAIGPQKTDLAPTHAAEGYQAVEHIAFRTTGAYGLQRIEQQIAHRRGFVMARRQMHGNAVNKAALRLVADFEIDIGRHFETEIFQHRHDPAKRQGLQTIVLQEILPFPTGQRPPEGEVFAFFPNQLIQSPNIPYRIAGMHQGSIFPGQQGQKTGRQPGPLPGTVIFFEKQTALFFP